MKSKRGALRYPCSQQTVSYKTAYDEGQAVLLNVSTTGCALEQPSLELSMHEKILVSIELPEANLVIEAQGVVVRIEARYTAVRFTQLESEDKMQVIKHFSKMMRKRK